MTILSHHELKDEPSMLGRTINVCFECCLITAVWCRGFVAALSCDSTFRVLLVERIPLDFRE